MTTQTEKPRNGIKGDNWEAFPERLIFHDRLVEALLTKNGGVDRLIVAAFEGALPGFIAESAALAICKINGITFILMENFDLKEGAKLVAGTDRPIGIAKSKSASISTPDRLLVGAADAMERAKTAASRLVTTVVPSETDQRGLLTAQELSDPGLSLMFQPQALVTDGSLIGVEVLARVPGENGAVVSAERFFAGLDRRALIRFDHQILKRSLLKAAEWQAQGYPIINVAVNFPLDAFDMPGASEVILNDLKASTFPPECFVLELTEVAPARNLEVVRAELTCLRKAGVGLALDDLGRGYASLSLLHALPFTRVKMDRVFVDGIDRSRKARGEISALIQAARDDGLTILAEGVERESQRSYLAELGCDYYQGFLYHPALSLENFEAILTSTASKRQGYE